MVDIVVSVVVSVWPVWWSVCGLYGGRCVVGVWSVWWSVCGRYGGRIVVGGWSLCGRCVVSRNLSNTGVLFLPAVSPNWTTQPITKQKN